MPEPQIRIRRTILLTNGDADLQIVALHEAQHIVIEQTADGSDQMVKVPFSMYPAFLRAMEESMAEGEGHHA